MNSFDQIIMYEVWITTLISLSSSLLKSCCSLLFNYFFYNVELRPPLKFTLSFFFFFEVVTHKWNVVSEARLELSLLQFRFITVILHRCNRMSSFNTRVFHLFLNKFFHFFNLFVQNFQASLAFMSSFIFLLGCFVRLLLLFSLVFRLPTTNIFRRSTGMHMWRNLLFNARNLRTGGQRLPTAEMGGLSSVYGHFAFHGGVHVRLLGIH